MSNFEFLKNIDKNLYEIALGAEKLYRDEYFEQCITQTRRLAENLCKNVLKDNAAPSDSFDEMLATLKDKSNGSEREKEFVNDLYYLKTAGNRSVHSLKVKQDAIEALECLQRAFEASVNFALSIDKTNKKLLAVRFDEELLVLGVKKEQTLKEKYLEQKAREMRGKHVKEDFSKEYKAKQKKQAKPRKAKATKPFFFIFKTFFMRL